jgi:hypothetical protein
VCGYALEDGCERESQDLRQLKRWTMKRKQGFEKRTKRFMRLDENRSSIDARCNGRESGTVES